MPDQVRFTLLGDGPFDRSLLPIVQWVLVEAGVSVPIQRAWADLENYPRRPRRLSERIAVAIDLFPADVLFVHRDAESVDPALRIAEVETAIQQARRSGSLPKHVAVVPVRMTEAWLLFDKDLIRRASGNPNGRGRLALPRRGDSPVDPKETLHSLLLDASGLNHRRRDTFNTAAAAYRIAELADNFVPLRRLPAFSEFEARTAAVARSLGF